MFAARIRRQRGQDKGTTAARWADTTSIQFSGLGQWAMEASDSVDELYTAGVFFSELFDLSFRKWVMKRPMTLLAFVFTALLTATAQTAPSASGTWALAYDVAGLSINMTCVVTQADNKLTGTCTGDDKVAHALTGEVKGQSVTFKFDKTYDGSPITDTFTAPDGMAAGKMKGTMSVSPLDVSGTFTATKQ